MIELNKEYTYQEICKCLGWECYSGGNSKKAQIKAIETAFKFYHPMNKKTHKEKKSYIFTEQVKEPVEPIHGGSNNNKNISPMMDYILARLLRMCEYEEDWLSEPHTITACLCGLLNLIDKDIYNVPYLSIEEIKAYCKKHSVDISLFVDYLSILKRNAKSIFLKSLEVLEKKEMIEYLDGYNFYYYMRKNSRTTKLGNVFTVYLNETVKAHETYVCNVLNRKYSLSKKMKGRQLLLQIYGNKDYKEEFDELIIAALTDDNNVIDTLNKAIDDNYGICGEAINDEHEITSYYRSIVITAFENDVPECNIEKLAEKVSSVIIEKSRKELLNKHYTSKREGKTVYSYDKLWNADDIIKVEKLLFKFYDENLAEQMYFMPGIDDWGEPNEMEEELPF